MEISVQIVKEYPIVPKPGILPLRDPRSRSLRQIGDIYPGQILPFFSEGVTFELIAHGKQHSHKEVGGLLIGQYGTDGEIKYVWVQHSIRADKADSSGAALRFTSEDNLRMAELKEEKYPNDVVLGWYHTHPGFGAFFSSTDRGTQHRVWSSEYHLGLVIDPTKEEFGLFGWRAGQFIGPMGFWLIKGE